ncbi:MAG TPA: Mur ligase domain-containing protein, partial [Anaerolineaceae bacterium]|nr:Mur ligase domain-containing protein [Anaerolineaceae bacterium]
MLTLKHILKALAVEAYVSSDFSITRGVVDSRCVEKGDLFIAMPGENTDGHLFVDRAFKSGAV